LKSLYTDWNRTETTYLKPDVIIDTFCIMDLQVILLCSINILVKTSFKLESF